MKYKVQMQELKALKDEAGEIGAAWILVCDTKKKRGAISLHCSECGVSFSLNVIRELRDNKLKYCFNCGAVMSDKVICAYKE